ncbi:ATP/GTP-binding protein [soil metagenome]
MKQLFLPILLAVVIFACQTTKQESNVTTGAPTLTLKWKSDTLLTTCESVIYDDTNSVLYVANINGDPSGKDGNGFISKVDLDGKITNLKWVTGMDAPKGMGIISGKLYVSDIDRVHEIDIASGNILNTYKAEGAKFLNDVATGSDGKVFISDSGTGQVLLLENGKISLWTSQPNPNGLLVENGALLIALWDAKTLNSIDLETKVLTQKTDSIDNPDGIEAVGDGGYFVSSWNGMIHYVSSDWKRTLLLDTRPDSVSAADIEYIPSKKLLLVPTFFKNRVDAYELK